MQLPVEQSPYTPVITTGQAFIDFMQTHEADYIARNSGEGSPTSLYRASLDIGRICVALDDNHVASTASQELLLGVLGSVKERYSATDPTSSQYMAAIAVASSALLICDRQEPSSAVAIEEVVHKDVTDAAWKTLQKLTTEYDRTPSRRRRSLAGYLSDTVTVSLLSRPQNVRLGKIGHNFVTPALPHHENAQKGGSNYDALYMHIYPSIGTYTARKLQIKSHCMSLRSHRHENDEARQAYSSYDPDISLVSVCCDLVHPAGDNPSPFQSVGQIVTALKHEVENEAYPEEIDKLDYLQSSLVHAINFDSRRQGHRTPRNGAAALTPTVL